MLKGSCVTHLLCRSHLLCSTALILLVSEAAADRVYSVQLGAFPTVTEAEERLAQTGPYQVISQIRAEQTSGGETLHRVLLGRYRYYAEAWILREQVGRQLVPDAFIRTWDTQDTPTTLAELERLLPFTGAETAAEPPEEGVSRTSSAARALEQLMLEAEMPTTVSVSAEVLAKEPEAMKRNELLDVGFGATSETLSKECLRHFTTKHEADTSAPAAHLKLAHKLLREGKYDELRPHLEEGRSRGNPAQQRLARHIEAYCCVAEKKTSTAMALLRGLAEDPEYPNRLRREAMRAFCGVAHKAKEYDRAWLGFAQVAATAADPEEKLEARMQLAGLAYELVLNGKGTWDEVLELCGQVITAPDVPRRVKATASLMHMEAQHYMKNLDTALAEAEAILAQYPDQRREYLTALAWRGAILFDLRRLDEAQAVFESLLTEAIGPADLFADFHPRARALGFLAYIAAVRKDAGKLSFYTESLRAEFPASRELSQVLSLRIVPEPAS